VNCKPAMNKPQKRYDAQFKRDAVELLLASGKPLKRLAEELGICDVTLRSWRNRHLAKTEPIEATVKRFPLNNWPRSSGASKKNSRRPIAGMRS
jgi:transposase-like protein